jgi:hypothetical protein
MSSAGCRAEVGSPVGQVCDAFGANAGRDTQGLAKVPAAAVLAPCLTGAAQPEALSQPAVVQKLVNTYMNAVADDALSLLDGAALHQARRALMAAMVDDAAYTRTPWHCREQLGEVLLACMNLPPDLEGVGGYEWVLARALSQVSDAAVDLSRGLRADSAAAELNAWVRKLELLGDFVAAVLMGTHSLSHPGQTLQDQVLSLMSDAFKANKTQ